MGEPIFFIGILPPKEIQREIKELQQYASEHFNSSHALKSPPHITLFPPFRWDEEKLDELEDLLKVIARTEPTFYLHLNNLSCFAPHVIYIDVEDKPELLNFQKKIERSLESILELKNTSPHEYSPHITVAFKDLKRPFFLKAWAHYAQVTYERMFQVEIMTLLKHDGLEWQIFNEFQLKSK